jgi:hypothetical protein
MGVARFLRADRPPSRPDDVRATAPGRCPSRERASSPLLRRRPPGAFSIAKRSVPGRSRVRGRPVPAARDHRRAVTVAPESSVGRSLERASGRKRDTPRIGGRFCHTEPGRDGSGVRTPAPTGHRRPLGVVAPADAVPAGGPGPPRARAGATAGGSGSNTLRVLFARSGVYLHRLPER